MAGKLEEFHGDLEQRVEQRMSELATSLSDLRSAQDRLIQTQSWLRSISSPRVAAKRGRGTRRLDGTAVWAN
jgi:hypothetical protein